MDIHAAIQQLADACGVSTSTVETFAQLTVTQYRKGLEGAEAIQAAADTSRELAKRAIKSIQDCDSTNPYGPRTSFAHTLYDLLTAPCGPAKPQTIKQGATAC